MSGGDTWHLLPLEHLLITRLSFISLDFASCRRDFEEFLPGFTMNVFDRNINLDALFTFSQMYV